MIEPIKAGDKAEVIDGALGKASPNIGKIVRVVSFRGEHSVYGRIWKAQADNLVSEYGATGDSCDFAQSWLRKIPPLKNPDVSQETEKALDVN